MLVSSPPSFPLAPADQMLSFVPWLQGVDNSIAKFMKVTMANRNTVKMENIS